MTGYGKAEFLAGDHKTVVEIKSLNSKQLDLNLKIQPYFREKENAIRQLLSPLIERGKVDLTIYRQSAQNGTTIDTDNTAFGPINKEAFHYYYNELLSLGVDPTGLAASIVRIPGVIAQPTTEQVMPETEWSLLEETIKKAFADFEAFRIQEGAALETMFTTKLNGIADLLKQVEPFETNRVANIKSRLLSNLEDLAAKTKQEIDQNRLEAELIYYLEKLDITEEKVRLTNHIRYFREVMAGHDKENDKQLGVGKKLGFIAQEMGREINTLGSKSNQSEMQIIVVKMKDILEQIKEQVLNVL